MKKDAVLEIARWQAADQHRDQLQAQLDRLDADPRVDVDDRLREALDDAISDADDECEAAEMAFYRAEGDTEKVRELEMWPFERAMILADLFPPDDDEDDR